MTAGRIETSEGTLPVDAVASAEAGAARRRLMIRIAQVAVGAAILLAWEFASGRLIDPFFISAPMDVSKKPCISSHPSRSHPCSRESCG